ncbi:MAG: hypothetical protein WA191_06220 [Telluria sp.]|nr:hypothetical protein [Telluria sp.]
MTSALDSLQFGPGLDVAACTRAAADPQSRLENQDNLLLIDTHGRAVFMRDQQQQHQRVSGWPQGHARLAVFERCGSARAMRQALFDEIQERPPAGLHMDNISAVVLRVAPGAAPLAVDVTWRSPDSGSPPCRKNA